MKDSATTTKRALLSGYYFAKNGWTRSGNQYKKGDDLVVYDGVHWYYYPIPECFRFTPQEGLIRESRIIEFSDQILR